MEAIGLFLSKFSDELLSAQIAVLSFAMALGIYWMLIRKKKRETAEWVPAALVRAYLDRMHADERETRIRLFGESSVAPQAGMPLTQMLSGAGQTVTQTVITQDPALLKEVEALRGQLATADSRAMEFDRTMNGLRAEKSVLEQKVKDALAAAAAAPAGAGAPNPAVAKELEDLKEKLREYEVIEDDLANLKKFQKENEQLKARISALEGGAPALTVVPGGATAAPVTTTVANTTQKIETPVTVVAAAKPAPAAPAPAPVAAAPEPAPAAPAPESNTNVLAPVNPAAEAAPAEAKSSKQKEEELLSEFEKMLAS
ncbi:MAG: hypothetical protein ACXWR1_11660 [Bdellovibrionota bacterium]